MSDENRRDEDELIDFQNQNLDDVIFEKNSQKKIIWLPMDFAIQLLYQMKKDGDLDPSPGWQREYVFDRTKASRLIESVLLDVPIPAVYFAEEADGSYSVIDGQQRLSTFFYYMDDQFPTGKSHTEFKLTGLQVMTELNKLKYADLDKSLKLKIKNTPIHVIIIKKDSDDDVKFDIFERLNTGSMKLNEDEIRNSVYRGPYIDLLDELANDETFNRLVRKPNFHTRMLYRGMILRFFALTEKNYMLYRPSIKQYCNKELRDKRFMQKEKAEEYRGRFKKCVELCSSIFGENSFRRFMVGIENNKNGYWVTSRINMSLFDVQMCGFALYESSQFQGHWDEIREAMLDLMCNDQEFIDSIEMQTSSTDKMQIRFKKWINKLNDIVSPSQPRTYSYALKKELFKEDPTCKICRNRIMTIEDAEVDHKDPHSKGGPTTRENAQIAHRYCNRRKYNNT